MHSDFSLNSREAEQCFSQEGSLLYATLHRLLLLSFLTFNALVANPKKTTLQGGQSRSWFAEQGKKEILKVWQRPPPSRAARSEKKIKK